MGKRRIAAFMAQNFVASALGIPNNLLLPFAAFDTKYDPHYGTEGTKSLKSGPQQTYNNVDDCNWEDEEVKEKKDETGHTAWDKDRNDALRSTICNDKPKVTWDDVAGLDEAKKELQRTVELPRRFPQLFTGRREPTKAILLYGPPGTGKGHLIKALASGVDSTLMVISSSDIQCKWHGESERTVRLVFENARRKKPSIIFFDEIEALCGSRDKDSGSETDNRVKSEFLVQMEGAAHHNSGILIVAATNLPWTLDPAFRRRLQKKIHIALPDQVARKRMFKIKVGDISCNVSEEDYEEFATKTEGFSGSDITNLVQAALMEPIKRIQDARYWRKIGGRYTPCQLRDEGAMTCTWRQIPPDKLLEPAVAAQDFHSALAAAKSSVSQEELQHYHDWTKQYGMEGAKWMTRRSRKHHDKQLRMI